MTSTFGEADMADDVGAESRIRRRRSGKSTTLRSDGRMGVAGREGMRGYPTEGRCVDGLTARKMRNNDWGDIA